jgi:GGDEF domain-containing protein
MLARQTITRWQFAAGQLRARSSAPAAQTRRIEIELGLGQLQAVAERLRPLLKSRDMARRFESEELLVQIDGLSADLVALQAENPAPAEVPRPRTAAEIEERFRAALALKAAE